MRCFRSVIAGAVVFSALGCTCLKGAEPNKRLAVPSPDEISKNLRLVKEVLADEYAKTSAAGRASLAATLLKQAADTKGDRAARYVLLTETRDVAVKAGVPLIAADAAEQLLAEYDIPPGKAWEPLAGLATVPMSPDNIRAAAEALQGAGDAAVAGDGWDAAVALFKAADIMARKARNFPLAAQARTRLTQAEKMKAQAGKVSEHMAKLRANPNDPTANLAVGRFLCLVKRDWDAAIPLLAKGASGPLKDAVQKDIQAVDGTAAQQMAAADAWYEMAANTVPDVKASLQLRARHWYMMAIPNSAGLNKAKAEKRAKELQPATESAADKSKIWLYIRKAVANHQLKRWPIVGGSFAHNTFEEVPPTGAILIGFRYTTIGNGRYPGVVQAIYLTATGEVAGKIFGFAEPGAVPQIVKAKPGYAVGAIYVRGGGGFDAFKPIFMRIKETGLDTEDKYEGPHIGGQGGGDGTVGGDGQFIVGLHGKVGDKGKMDAMSAVSLANDSAPASDSRGRTPDKD